jgi:lipoyl(octanoyl) transferase
VIESVHKQKVHCRDLGRIPYQQAWDLQEQMLEINVQRKSAARNGSDYHPSTTPTDHHLLLCEHEPVYTLGKSGSMDHVLMSEEDLHARNIQFFRTNRGGDITFHGLGQLVGYPILDLEKFTTDIGLYLRNLEETIIQVMALYGLKGVRSAGETGVWLDPDKPGRERKICAIGVRCSRWITMHGFALNVNTDLGFFNHIIPCGIVNKKVTSLQAELGREVDMNLVKQQFKQAFETVFDVELTYVSP